MKPWAQELLWVRRDDNGISVRIEESLPIGADFIPTVPRLVERDPAQYIRNNHDEKRKQSVIKSLQTAKEKANTACLYLVANGRDQEDILNINLVLEHLEIALKHLEVI